jgi:hypothetical protein
MHGTFFIPSHKLGRGEYMSWQQVAALAADGNEIGGHTLDHIDLPTVSLTEARRQVCADRNVLLSHGLRVTDFAYPHGAYNSAVESVVEACGYNSARTVSGVSIHVSKDKIGETVPPADPYATRTPPNPKKATKLSTMEQYVLNAEDAAANSGQTLWIQFVFHRYCASHCGAYTVQPDKFEALLQFLATERTAGDLAVETTAEVIGGPFNAAVQP